MLITTADYHTDSTGCGHGTITLVTWALDAGIVSKREGENRFVMDVPSGRLET